ncbi:hypothetical protein Bbelb_021460 [Branchiostoma belcheri]|nr:hypothetical protein Bbelb_021460 [Branchiostoma belcheri]
MAVANGYSEIRETHRKKEGDLLKQLEEEKASCKNLQYEKAQMEEEQKRLLWDLGNLREKSNEGSQISDENEPATSKGLGQKRHVSGEEVTLIRLYVRSREGLLSIRLDPLYKVGDFVVIAGEANDGKDRVPWFARVITTDPAKQRLTLRWYVPNKEGVYEREVLDGKPLKDESIRYAEILTSVQLTDRMTLPEEEMSKAWKAL